MLRPGATLGVRRVKSKAVLNMPHGWKTTGTRNGGHTDAASSKFHLPASKRRPPTTLVDIRHQQASLPDLIDAAAQIAIAIGIQSRLHFQSFASTLSCSRNASSKAGSSTQEPATPPTADGGTVSPPAAGGVIAPPTG